MNERKGRRFRALHGHVPPPLELVGSEVWQTFHEAPPQGGESGSQTRSNGGSAATASHFALDLAKNTIMAGAPRLKAISLTDNVPLITAWSNDTAYEHIFAEQLANMIEPGDVVIGISTSGNSSNVINALLLARQYRAATIALLGARGGKIKKMVDAYVLAPGQNIEQEEDAHVILTHVITRHMREVVRSYAEVPTPADGIRTTARVAP